MFCDLMIKYGLESGVYFGKIRKSLLIYRILPSIIYNIYVPREALLETLENETFANTFYMVGLIYRL